MNIDIYATTARSSYIAVPAGYLPPAHFLPEGVPPKPIKHLTLVSGKQLIGLDPDEVMADIAGKGWAAIGVTG